jgi:hypothetical protein
VTHAGAKLSFDEAKASRKNTNSTNVLNISDFVASTPQACGKNHLESATYGRGARPLNTWKTWQN